MVTLVLLDTSGNSLGPLPPFRVETPWWQEVGEIVQGARSGYGLDVAVLRLLHADRPAPPGGHVTYLAQLSAGGATAGPASHPLRQAYAEPGGPAASVRWAVDALAGLGRPGAVAFQQRTWNLSAIWRLDTGHEPAAWLKQVPPFFAHEPAMIRLVDGVAPGLVPPLWATGPAHRMLLGHVPGTDRYEPDPGLCAAVAERFHGVQVAFASRIGDLLAAGAPDRRRTDLSTVAGPYLDRIDGLRELIARLPDRLAAVAACGLPDTLVHGDLHTGNVRTDGDRFVLMDWGDATVGSPVLDVLRLTGGLPEADALIAAWARRWRASVPGCDPERAVALMRPVAELRAASVYAGFLSRIEESEHPYHAADVPDRLRAAVAADA